MGDGSRAFATGRYESAALDLALAQAGRPLHEVLGREPRPVSYVNSLGLGDPTSADTVLRRLERYPRLRFKLDAAATWTPEIVDGARGHRRRARRRLQGPATGSRSRTPDALAAPLRARARGAPRGARSRTRTTCPRSRRWSSRTPTRVSYDAPIDTVADLDAQPDPGRTFNIKPSRVGRLRDLFALYAACEERGLALYGGGMGELGVARGQIQLLAAMFSPDGPNDIAPPGFNALEPAAGLPLSPLEPDPAPVGFRRNADR